MKQIYRGLMALFCCLPFLAHAASTDIGFAPWTQKAKWYRAAAESDLTSLTPDSFTGGVACAWAVSENSVHTWNGTSWTEGGPCESGSASVGISSITPGTAATSLGKAEDAAHSSGDTGVAILVRRCDTASVGSDTDGDYSVPCVDSSGRLWTSSVNYVPDNSSESDAIDVDSAACTTTCPANYSLTVGTYGWGYVQCTIKNVGDGAGGTPTIDAMKIWLQSKDEDLGADTPPVLGGSTGVDADDFVSPVFPIIWARSGTAGAVDATPDMPGLDEGDSYEFQIDVRGAYSMKIGLSASADNTSVNIDCNGL